MTNLIVKGKEFKSAIGGVDVDFRFYREDGSPVMFKHPKEEYYHVEQVSSSFFWAMQDAYNHFKKELNELFPDGYLIQFEFTNLKGENIK